MNIYSQKNPAWAELEIVPGLKILTDGCFICSLAMLVQKTPDIVLNILKAKKCFNAQGMLLHPNDSLALGFHKYLKLVNGKDTKAPTNCIAETDHYAPNYPQHFFYYIGDNRIADPLDGKEKNLLTMDKPYRIVSFRVYT